MDVEHLILHFNKVDMAYMPRAKFEFRDVTRLGVNTNTALPENHAKAVLTFIRP